jgi:hypothetical protein
LGWEVGDCVPFYRDSQWLLKHQHASSYSYFLTRHCSEFEFVQPYLGVHSSLLLNSPIPGDHETLLASNQLKV